MIWQFGELGYDVSIDNPCRVCNKPILWNYYTQARRRQLYDVYSATLKLRNDYETFRSLNFNYNLSGAVKKMKMTHPSMNGVVITNFAVTAQNGSPNFHHNGWWYEYFTGDSLNVSDVNMNFALEPGEYRIYTDVRLEQPTITDAPVSIEELLNSAFELVVYPNPSSDYINLKFQALDFSPVEIVVLDQTGKEIYTHKGFSNFGDNSFYRIPETKREVRQIRKVLRITKGGKLLRTILDSSERVTRMHGNFPDLGSIVIEKRNSVPYAHHKKKKQTDIMHLYH
jgi:hypothetical protein